jgi:AbrB family looped-hinge helix DNA binding protein
MPSATLTSKGQITLPAEMRAKLRLVAGNRLDFEEQPDGSYVVRARKGDIRALKGIVPKPAKPVTLEDMDRAIREGASAAFLRS